jgi:hypothetical protein
VREQVSKLLLALWICIVHLCQPNAIYVHAFVLFLCLCMGFAPLTLFNDIVLSANGLIASTAKVSAACTYPNGSCV